MRIVIDMQGAQTESRFRGIGRYTRAIAQAIVRNRQEHEVVLALNGLFPDSVEPIRAAFDGLLPQEDIRVWYAPGPLRESESGNEWRREVAEQIRESFLASLRPDIVLVSSLFEGFIDDAVTSVGVFTEQIPTAVILYDLIPLLNPDAYLNPNPGYAKYYHRKIGHLKCANLWLAISESAAREGCDVMGLDDDKVVNISTACDPVFRPMAISEKERRDFLRRLCIAQPFVLYSGGADIRKNLPRMIQAFAQLPASLRNTHQLLLAGKMPDGARAELQRLANSSGLHKKQLLFSGYVSDEDLARLYNLCTAFVFPSLHEGFGLPALEAMSCGAAVIGASASSIPEVIGRPDALFDPNHAAAITQKMEQVLGDATFRAELAAHGLVQARKFSWDESARRAILALEKRHSHCGVAAAGPEGAGDFRGLIRAIAAVVPPKFPATGILQIAYLIGRNSADGNARKQLLIDISELAQHDAKTGVQRVTRSILKELLESPPEGYVVEPVYATPFSYGYQYARAFTARFQDKGSELADEPIEYRPGDIFLGLDLQHHVLAAQRDFLAGMRRDGVEVNFVVYDLLPVLMPNVFPPGANVNHQHWLQTLLSFDGAICISRAVADELAEWQRSHGPKRLRPFHIGWFHLGADLENSAPTWGLPADVNQVLAALAERPSFLMVGTVEPRKGHKQVLGAFEQLWQSCVDVNLVIVGKQGWQVEGLVRLLRAHPELNSRLFWLEGISDEYLEKVYAASTCLVAASYGEGFGLPLIEAAQHRLPIIARDIPVFREVAGDHAYYFDATTPEGLAQSLKSWLDLYRQGIHPASDGMPWLTWKESAARLINVILGRDNCSVQSASGHNPTSA